MPLNSNHVVIYVQMKLVIKCGKQKAFSSFSLSQYEMIGMRKQNKSIAKSDRDLDWWIFR